MSFIDSLGLIAGGLTTGSLVPQLVRIIKLKSTADISLGMFLMSFLGLICWVICGAYLKSMALVISSSLSVIMVFIIILYKLKYK